MSLVLADMASAAPPQDAIDRIRLARTHRIGQVGYAQLIARFGSASAALAALPDLARKSGGSAPRPPAPDFIAAEFDRVRSLGGHYLFVDQPEYPALLRDAHGAPPVLIASGRTDLLARPAIAMVGARNASAAACRFARMLAADLGAAGVTVISGLVRGIDTAAHQGALATGTVGVIASGLDVTFPPENRALQQQLADEHLVLTEYPPGTEPLARQFPHRNRIIAWASIGTVVVEAAPRSGSLLTARLATEAGREVMAVPGSPLDPRAQGCNALIREGATLVQSAADVLEAISGMAQSLVRAPAVPPFAVPDVEPDDHARATITELLGPVPVAIDELVRQSGLSIAVVQTVLVELEITGRLERHAGARVSA
jgi:DNA processing protein